MNTVSIRFRSNCYWDKYFSIRSKL